MACSRKGRGAGFGRAHTAHGPTNPQAKQHEPPCSARPPYSPSPKLQGRKPAAALRGLSNEPVRYGVVGRPQRAGWLQNAHVRFALEKFELT